MNRLAHSAEIAVIELAGDVYIFDRARVTIWREGRLEATVPAPRVSWSAGAAIDSPEGGAWVVGIAGGKLWRVTPAGAVESVADRWHLDDAAILSIDSTKDALVFGLANGVAVVSDHAHVVIYAGGEARHVAAAKGRIAIARANSVDVVDLVLRRQVSFPIAGATSIGFLDPSGPHPRLAVARASQIYIEEGGSLRPMSIPSRSRQLLVTGDRLWIITRDGLYSLTASGTRERIATAVAPTSRLHSSQAGAVWLSSDGAAAKFEIGSSRGAEWDRVVAPVFARGCGGCHGPRGVAGLDLSTPDGWAANQSRVETVLMMRRMPPQGHEISDDDRSLLLRSTSHASGFGL